MNYKQLAYFHLAAIIPAFIIGTLLFIRRKGTPAHKILGRVYLVLMAATGLMTLWMPAHIGLRLLDHFGFIHLFSLLALCSVPAAYIAARQGRFERHGKIMKGLYIGGLLIAGAFAFLPGRMLQGWLFA